VDMYPEIIVRGQDREPQQHQRAPADQQRARPRLVNGPEKRRFVKLAAAHERWTLFTTRLGKAGKKAENRRMPRQTGPTLEAAGTVTRAETRRFLHVANGTSTTGTIEAAGIPGAVSIWADPLYEGPVPGGVSDAE